MGAICMSGKCKHPGSDNAQFSGGQLYEYILMYKVVNELKEQRKSNPGLAGYFKDYGVTDNDQYYQFDCLYLPSGTTLEIYNTPDSDNSGRVKDNWISLYVVADHQVFCLKLDHDNGSVKLFYQLPNSQWSSFTPSETKETEDVVLPTSKKVIANLTYGGGRVGGKVSSYRISMPPTTIDACIKSSSKALTSPVKERINNLLLLGKEKATLEGSEMSMQQVTWENPNGNNYRMYAPFWTDLPNGCFSLVFQFDHERGAATDDHGIISYLFDKDGNVIHLFKCCYPATSMATIVGNASRFVGYGGDGLAVVFGVAIALSASGYGTFAGVGFAIFGLCVTAVGAIGKIIVNQAETGGWISFSDEMSMYGLVGPEGVQRAVLERPGKTTPLSAPWVDPQLAKFVNSYNAVVEGHYGNFPVAKHFSSFDTVKDNNVWSPGATGSPIYGLSAPDPSGKNAVEISFGHAMLGHLEFNWYTSDGSIKGSPFHTDILAWLNTNYPRKYATHMAFSELEGSDVNSVHSEEKFAYRIYKPQGVAMLDGIHLTAKIDHCYNKQKDDYASIRLSFNPWTNQCIFHAPQIAYEENVMGAAIGAFLLDAFISFAAFEFNDMLSVPADTLISKGVLAAEKISNSTISKAIEIGAIAGTVIGKGALKNGFAIPCVMEVNAEITKSIPSVVDQTERESLTVEDIIKQFPLDELGTATKNAPFIGDKPKQNRPCFVWFCAAVQMQLAYLALETTKSMRAAGTLTSPTIPKKILDQIDAKCSVPFLRDILKKRPGQRVSYLEVFVDSDGKNLILPPGIFLAGYYYVYKGSQVPDKKGKTKSIVRVSLDGDFLLQSPHRKDFFATGGQIVFPLSNDISTLETWNFPDFAHTNAYPGITPMGTASTSYDAEENLIIHWPAIPDLNLEEETWVKFGAADFSLDELLAIFGSAGDMTSFKNILIENGENYGHRPKPFAEFVIRMAGHDTYAARLLLESGFQNISFEDAFHHYHLDAAPPRPRSLDYTGIYNFGTVKEPDIDFLIMDTDFRLETRMYLRGIYHFINKPQQKLKEEVVFPTKGGSVSWTIDGFAESITTNVPEGADNVESPATNELPRTFFPYALITFFGSDQNLGDYTIRYNNRADTTFGPALQTAAAKFVGKWKSKSAGGKTTLVIAKELNVSADTNYFTAAYTDAAGNGPTDYRAFYTQGQNEMQITDMHTGDLTFIFNAVHQLTSVGAGAKKVSETLVRAVTAADKLRIATEYVIGKTFSSETKEGATAGVHLVLTFDKKPPVTVTVKRTYPGTKNIADEQNFTSDLSGDNTPITYDLELDLRNDQLTFLERGTPIAVYDYHAVKPIITVTKTGEIYYLVKKS